MSRNLLILGVLVALLFPSAAAARTDALWQVSLDWPAQGTVTSPFGRDGYRWHPGLDIGTLQSLDVRAAADGIVTLAGYMPGYEGYGAIVAVHSGTATRRCTRTCRSRSCEPGSVSQRAKGSGSRAVPAGALPERPMLAP